MGPRLLQIDAFASGPFTGNPAAVCLLEAPAEEDWMRKEAMEMNLSETVTVLRGRLQVGG
jgi:predicted PhzF superfamily epimerase YddE/YHI9